MARVFARLLHDGVTVGEIIVERADITKEYNPGFLAAQCVEVTGDNPLPMPGWIKGAQGFAPPPPFEPTPAQLYAAAIAAGVAVVSASAPAISATYGIAQQDEINLSGLQAGIAAGAPWLGGYRDNAGLKHPMTAAQFTTLASALLFYVEALDDAYAAAAAGGAWSPPATPLEIA